MFVLRKESDVTVSYFTSLPSRKMSLSLNLWAQLVSLSLTFLYFKIGSISEE